MSHVERYHEHIRKAYLKSRKSLPRCETDSYCLKMTFNSVNNSIGPEGLCPTVLVFGAIHLPERKELEEKQLERVKVMDLAMNEGKKNKQRDEFRFV